MLNAEVRQNRAFIIHFSIQHSAFSIDKEWEVATATDWTTEVEHA